MGLSTGHPQPGCEAALAPICIPPTLPQPHKQPAESMVSQVDPRGFYLQSFSHLKHAQRVVQSTNTSARAHPALPENAAARRSAVPGFLAEPLRMPRGGGTNGCDMSSGVGKS